MRKVLPRTSTGTGFMASDAPACPSGHGPGRRIDAADSAPASPLPRSPLQATQVCSGADRSPQTCVVHVLPRPKPAIAVRARHTASGAAEPSTDLGENAYRCKARLGRLRRRRTLLKGSTRNCWTYAARARAGSSLHSVGFRTPRARQPTGTRSGTTPATRSRAAHRDKDIVAAVIACLIDRAGGLARGNNDQFVCFGEAWDLHSSWLASTRRARGSW